MSMTRPCPPSHTLRISPEPRNRNRFTGVDGYNGLSTVQRQWFLCALLWTIHFQLLRILLYVHLQLRSVARYGAVADARSMDV